jgi:hypothetical protein
MIDFGYSNYLTKRKQGECWQLSTPYFYFFRFPKSCFFLGLSFFFFEAYIKINKKEKGE